MPGAQHLLATVVEVTAEAGVAPDARCAEPTAEVWTVHLRVHNSEAMSWHCMGSRALWGWKYKLVTDENVKDGCEMDAPTYERDGAGQAASQTYL